MHDVTSPALAFVLGMCIADPKHRIPGRISTLVDELTRRGEWTPVTAALDPKLVAAINLATSVDRAKAKHHPRTTPHNAGVS